MEQRKSKFKTKGGWTSDDGKYNVMVKHNGGDSYTFQLAIGSISIFMNGGIYIIGGSAFDYKKTKCDFLGEIEFFHKIDLVKIKTGWFSSFMVSHDALVCLKDLGIPLITKSNWKEAFENKSVVLKHYHFLLDKEEKKEKEIDKINTDQKISREKNRNEFLAKKYGADDAYRLKLGKIWQGMTKDMLMVSRGKPGDIDETVYKTKTKAYYFYDSYTTRQDNIKFKFRVSLENDVVVGWKDLD